MNKANRDRGDRFEDFLKDFLGLEKQLGSGSGCIEREDLKDDNYLFQAKSTDKMSISVKLCDIEKLMESAEGCGLDAVFAIGFETGGRFIPSKTLIAVPLSVWMDM
jgi:hypothetical protein